MARFRKHPVTLRPQVRWRDPSGRERSKSFARATDARAYMAMINHEASLGELWDRSLSKTPFAEVAAAWLKGKVGLRRSSLTDAMLTDLSDLAANLFRMII